MLRQSWYCNIVSPRYSPVRSCCYHTDEERKLSQPIKRHKIGVGGRGGQSSKVRIQIQVASCPPHAPSIQPQGPLLEATEVLPPPENHSRPRGTDYGSPTPQSAPEEVRMNQICSQGSKTLLVLEAPGGRFGTRQLLLLLR